MTDPTRQETLARLRQTIARLEGGAPKVQRGRLSTQADALDGALGGGLPRPGLVELTGPAGTGRLSLVLPCVAALTARREPVAVVDPLGRVFPPGWTGVVAERLVIVQPAPEQAAWAGEQLARSGAFPLVLLLEPPRLGRAGARLGHAAEQGGATVLLLAERSDPLLRVELRLCVHGREGERVCVEIIRSRGGGAGQRIRI
ncbi:MAG: hypothetical protein H6739_12545 [Alphaproteobacteria bacterium]|nr:hypothetical protein [Alphaproteobacteria bacterium]